MASRGLIIAPPGYLLPHILQKTNPFQQIHNFKQLHNRNTAPIVQDPLDSAMTEKITECFRFLPTTVTSGEPAMTVG
jgi:hypothetical protein